MPANWSALAQKSDDIYEEDDFRKAFQQLVSYQVLYARNPQQVTSYRIVSSYRAAFKEASDLLGYRLEWNDIYSYCYIIPTVSKAHQLDMDETRFILTLRKIYHSRALQGEQDSSGEMSVLIEELSSSYKTLTGHDLPKTQGALKDLIHRVSRYGIAKIGERAEGDLQPFTVTILPAIADVLSENVISRLGASIKASLVGKESVPQESERDITVDNKEKPQGAAA